MGVAHIPVVSLTMCHLLCMAVVSLIHVMRTSEVGSVRKRGISKCPPRIRSSRCSYNPFCRVLDGYAIVWAAWLQAHGVEASILCPRTRATCLRHHLRKIEFDLHMALLSERARAGMPKRVGKCAGWYIRVCALVWVLRRTLLALLVHRLWGNVFHRVVSG